MNRLLYYLLFLSILVYTGVQGQGYRQISLDEALRLGTDSTLQSFMAENLYLSSYWEFRSFKAELLPHAELISTLADYNRSLTKRFNSVLNIDEYKEQQNIYSSLNAAFRQNIGLTGGTLYFDTELGRIRNFGTPGFTQYSTVPFRVGIIQPVFGYNRFRWQKKTEPMRYEMAKRRFVQSFEAIAGVTVDYYFGLLEATMEFRLSETIVANADSLLAMGRQRYQLSGITRADLLTLELDVLNAQTGLLEAQKKFRMAHTVFCSYLRIPDSTQLQLLLPAELAEIMVSVESAINYTLSNNPQLPELKIKEWESAALVDKLKRERQTITFSASYGQNQQSSQLTNAYQNPLDQQRAIVGISVPILDWGQMRGRLNMARKNLEYTRLSSEQELNNLIQEVRLITLNLTMQRGIILKAAKAREAAGEIYRTNQQRFLFGQVDVNSLNINKQRMVEAELAYIAAVRDYWTFLYKFRAVTLFNPVEGTQLMDEWDKKFKL